MNQEQLRLECLRLATLHNQNTNEILIIANEYLKFINNEKIINNKNPIEFINSYFKLRDYQENAINLIHNNNKVVFNWARQIGITTTVLNYIYYYVMNNENKNVLLLAPKFTQAVDTMDVFRTIFEKNNTIKNTIEYNNYSTKLNNNSKIKCQNISENTGRGFSPDLIYIDSAAFISHKISNDFWNSLMPCIKEKTKIIVSSVPNENKGLFYDLINNPLFLKNTITAEQSKIYDNEKLKHLRYMLGKNAKQELDCEFKE